MFEKKIILNIAEKCWVKLKKLDTKEYIPWVYLYNVKKHMWVIKLYWKQGSNDRKCQKSGYL